MAGLLYVRRSGAHYSEGARLLWHELTLSKLSQAALQRELKLSQGAIGRWLRGDRLPDELARAKLFARFGINPSAWDQKAHARAAKFGEAS
jgi:transcriptional regulator with XRE-family HTH domain